jgi:hypothetical protein
VAERDEAAEQSTFEWNADRDDAQSQESADDLPSATIEAAMFDEAPRASNEPDLAKAFFEVDIERAMAVARSELGSRSSELGGGDSDPTDDFFAVDIERAVLTVRDELGEVAARADNRRAVGPADASDPAVGTSPTDTDRMLHTMLRELKKKPE